MYNSSLKLASIIQDSDHLFFLLLLCLTSKSFNHPFLSLSALQENSCENGSILPNCFFIQRDVKVDRWQNTGGKKKKMEREMLTLLNTSGAHWVVVGSILFPSLNLKESARFSFCLGHILCPVQDLEHYLLYLFHLLDCLARHFDENVP